MLQGHFVVEIGQGGFSPFGILPAPVDEKADANAPELAQDPHGVALAYAAAIFIGADIQALVQASFNAPIGTLRLQPLRG